MASRDITCHQLVLEDHPLGLAPTQDSPLTCLSCYTRLEEESSVECECGFRMCLSPECRQDETHKPEHDLFVRAGVRSQGRADYPLVMPIRLLTLLEGAGLETRDRLGRLMDHREDRRRPGGEWVQGDSSSINMMRVMMMRNMMMMMMMMMRLMMMTMAAALILSLCTLLSRLLAGVAREQWEACNG